MRKSDLLVAKIRGAKGCFLKRLFLLIYSRRHESWMERKLSEKITKPCRSLCRKSNGTFARNALQVKSKHRNAAQSCSCLAAASFVFKWASGSSWSCSRRPRARWPPCLLRTHSQRRCQRRRPHLRPGSFYVRFMIGFTLLANLIWQKNSHLTNLREEIMKAFLNSN